MNKKITGFIFLGMTLIDVALLVIMRSVHGFRPGVYGRLILSEAIMILPCLAGWLASHDSFTKAFGISGIKLKLIPACMLLTILLTPLTALVNLSTLFFTENEAGVILNSLSELPAPVIFLFVAVIGPCVEEWCFRGLLFTGIRKSGSALQAILISALAFGLFHMNINQAAYAFMLGLFFAILRELSESILPSVICHVCINGSSTLTLLLGGDKAVTQAGEVMTKDMMLIAAGGLMVIALITTTLALALLMWVADVCGKENGIAGIFASHKNEKSSVLTIPYLAGCAICIFYIIKELLPG